MVLPGQGFSKVVKVTSVAVISNRAFSGGIRARLGNRGYIRDFGKTLITRVLAAAAMVMAG